MTAEHSNPYKEAPEVMRTALADPTINVNEHTIYAPALWSLLPPRGLPFSRWRIRRVLDFGCGAGNFTEQLADKYPHATVVGVDAVSEMLPKNSTRPNLSFRQWDGSEPLNEKPFDLIVAKMVLHYISPESWKQVMSNIVPLLGCHGDFLASVPYQWNLSRGLAKYGLGMLIQPEEIGNTGLAASIPCWGHDIWSQILLWCLPKDYVCFKSEVCNSEGTPKRINLLLSPRREAPKVAANMAFGRAIRRLLDKALEDETRDCLGAVSRDVRKEVTAIFRELLAEPEPEDTP